MSHSQDPGMLGDEKYRIAVYQDGYGIDYFRPQERFLFFFWRDVHTGGAYGRHVEFMYRAEAVVWIRSRIQRNDDLRKAAIRVRKA